MKTITNNSFILDSECTQHMSKGEIENYLTNITASWKDVKIETAKNNQVLYTKKQGTVKVNVKI